MVDGKKKVNCLIMKIALVLCYGVYESTNDHYRGYLDRVLAFIKEGEFDQVIIAGGYSNKDLEISESKAVYDYYLSIDESLKDKLILEESSLTTEENIQFVGHLLKEKNSEVSELVVFCDSIRMIKVYMLSMFYFAVLCGFEYDEEKIYLELTDQCLNKQPNLLETTVLQYENILIQGMGLSRSINEVSLQISSTLLEVGSLRYPPISKTIIEWRKNLWGVKRD